MTYTPATQDQLLAIRVNAGIEELAQSERFAAAEPDMVEAIVGGIGEFAAGEWAPLNRVGDLEGAKLENGVVTLPDGFAAAYEHYVEQGWNAISGPAEFGGQGLPFTLSFSPLGISRRQSPVRAISSPRVTPETHASVSREAAQSKHAACGWAMPA